MRCLKVRERNLVRDANGTINLKYVMGNRFKKNGYTHICTHGVIHNASIVNGIVWVDGIYKH